MPLCLSTKPTVSRKRSFPPVAAAPWTPLAGQSTVRTKRSSTDRPPAVGTITADPIRQQATTDSHNFRSQHQPPIRKPCRTKKSPPILPIALLHGLEISADHFATTPPHDDNLPDFSAPRKRQASPKSSRWLTRTSGTRARAPTARAPALAASALTPPVSSASTALTSAVSASARRPPTLASSSTGKRTMAARGLVEPS